MSTVESLVLQGKPTLAQFWAAIKMGNTFVLTTTNQPYALLGINEDLLAYHIACLDHKFYVYKNPQNHRTRVAFGLPARVFLSCSPEQTRDVHECPPDHRPPCEDAIFTKKWGSFALPVIINGNYVGVLAFVTDTRSYERDIDEVYRSLEYFGLRSSNRIYYQGWTLIKQRVLKRKRPSADTAKYNLLARLFGLPKADAARLLGLKEGTFRNVCRGVGILEWPTIRKNRRASKTSSSETTVFEDLSFDWEKMIPEWSREQLATQTNQEAPLDFMLDFASMEYPNDNMFMDNKDSELLEEWINELRTDNM